MRDFCVLAERTEMKGFLVVRVSALPTYAEAHTLAWETALSCPVITKKLCRISLSRILCGIFCVLAERTERKRFLAVRVPEGCLQPEETRRGAPACGKRRYPVRYYRNTLTRILCGIFVFWRRGQRGRGSLRFACRLCRHTPRLTRLRGKRRYPVR